LYWTKIILMMQSSFFKIVIGVLLNIYNWCVLDAVNIVSLIASMISLGLIAGFIMLLWYKSR
jgi:hypothetical protein